MSGLLHARLDDGERTIQPDHDAVLLEQLNVFRMSKGSSAQSHDSWLAFLDLRYAPLKRRGLQLAEFGFSACVEDLVDGNALPGFDVLVNVREGPAQLIGKQPADRGLARCH